jgi:aminopeptidase N
MRERLFLVAPAALLSGVTLLSGLALPAQEARNVSGGVLIPEQACYDVEHYDLTVSIDPASRLLVGKLSMRAKLLVDTPKLALDLDPAYTVDEVRLDGEMVEFAHREGRIWIAPKEALLARPQLVVAVSYAGVPPEAKNPPWQGGFTWKQTKDGKPWIATSCQGEGADLWWPCKDHPSDKANTIDLRVTVPQGLVVASNGVQQGDPVENGKQWTFHWHVASPISNYNLALNIAPYVELRDNFTCIDGTVMPIRFFVLPESEAKAKLCMPQFLDHIRVFEEILGPYPFRAEKYGIAETPHLGMEHQTIIAYGNGFGDEQWDWLHNHELAHEWWGNLVTCRDWKDMWIHEGFGTYMQALYRERRFGRKAYQEEMRSAVALNRAPVAPRDSKTTFEIYFGNGGSNDIYKKGSWILHTLRWQLGDEAFFRVLHEFCYPTEQQEKATDGSQCRFVDTEEFVALCSRIAGEDLGWFFELYLRQPVLPKLVAQKVGDWLELQWQTPNDLPFAVPAPVGVSGKEVRVPMVGGKGRLEIGDAEFVLDPEHRVLLQRPRAR